MVDGGVNGVDDDWRCALADEALTSLVPVCPTVDHVGVFRWLRSSTAVDVDAAVAGQSSFTRSLCMRASQL